jgi:hypothetical protein
VNAIELVNSCIGTVSSREDGSVAFRVNTAELRPSERGIVMDFHGKSCSVTIKPHDGPPTQTVRVDTERKVKSQSERLYAVLYVIWKQNPVGNFEDFRRARMETIIEETKRELPDE